MIKRKSRPQPAPQPVLQPAAPPRRLSLTLLELCAWAALAAAGISALRSRPAPPPAQPGRSFDQVLSPDQYDAAEPGRGRLAARPTHIPAQGWKDVLWRAYSEISDDRLPAVAGGVTFYVLLALFPALGVFVSLYGLVADVGMVREQLADLAAFVPADVLRLVGDQMLQLALRPPAALGAAFAFSLLLSVWSAKAGVAALIDGLNIAYDEAEKRPWLRRTALAYLATLGVLIFLTLATGLLVGAPLLLDRLGLGESQAFLAPIRWFLVLILAFGGFTLTYRYGPSRAAARWPWLVWGAAFAALAWVGGSLAFSWYVNAVAHYDVTYGALGAAVVLMVWIWWSAMIVLIGAELNAEIEHQTALDTTTGPPAAMGHRGAVVADTVGLSFSARAALGRAWSQGRDGLRRLTGAAGSDQPNSSSRVARRAAWSSAISGLITSSRASPSRTLGRL